MDKKNDSADRSKERCSYSDMIHHLEVLNTLPPTNCINTEIEFVRQKALEALLKRDKKDDKDREKSD